MRNVVRTVFAETTEGICHWMANPKVEYGDMHYWWTKKH
jgi:hypothetical protein